MTKGELYIQDLIFLTRLNRGRLLQVQNKLNSCVAVEFESKSSSANLD
jgi:hypothetical protein